MIWDVIKFLLGYVLERCCFVLDLGINDKEVQNMIVVDELRTYPIERIGPAARRFGTSWCHLMNDGTREELHAFAARLGIPRAAFQDHPTLWHYDLNPALREQAIRLGAQEVQILDWIEGDWLRKREQAQGK